MSEKTNCSIIRDLIPLCSEGLCSAESRALVEAHTASCEECRRLYAALPEEPAAEITVPEETKALRKVSRKLKRGRVWVTLLVLLVLGVTYLSIGQIARNGSIQSFETLFRNIEVYPVASCVARGDFDRYEQYLASGSIGNLYILSNLNAIRRQDIENLKTTYQAAYGNTKVRSIYIASCYTEMLAERSKAIVSYIHVRYADGRTAMFQANKNIDGLWNIELLVYSTGEESEILPESLSYADPYDYETDSAIEAFSNAIRFANFHDHYPLGFLEKLMTVKETPKTMETKSFLISNRFHEEYRETIRQHITDYFEAGYISPEFSLSTPRYDTAKEQFYYVFTLTGQDAEGTALMTGHIYYDYKGMLPPEDVTIYPDGCTPALTDAMAHLFG